jgi:hypothetical protein
VNWRFRFWPEYIRMDRHILLRERELNRQRPNLHNLAAHLIHTLDDYIRDVNHNRAPHRTGCPESVHDRQPCGDLTMEPLTA